MKYVLFELVKKGKGDKWHSRIKASNGKTLYASEEYSSLTKCRKMVEIFMRLFGAANQKKMSEGQEVKIKKFRDKKHHSFVEKFWFSI